MAQKETGLDNAYALGSPDDNKRLYDTWAATYDDDFAGAMDYRLPHIVAQAYADAGGAGPVLDIGVGTGLVGVVLAERGIGPIDGTDISPEMLAVAGKKGLYKGLFESDITLGMGVPDGTYAGAVSSGTFTLGHIGPDCLDEVFRVVRSGGLIVLSINRRHFDNAGFAPKIEAIKANCAALAMPEVAIYGANATGDHARDTALIVIARKT